MDDMKLKTIRLRVKDKHAKTLQRMAKSVNLVWNYINELSSRAITERRQFLSAYDIQKYTNGCAAELGLHSHTVQCIGKAYVDRRIQAKRTKLRWRKSSGKHRSLGWIPINTDASSWKNGRIYHSGMLFDVWDSYGLATGKFRAGCFSEDSRGRWYFNTWVESQITHGSGQDAVGIDLGLKTTATCSDGSKLEAGFFYVNLEDKLASAQRARNKTRVRAIHAKIANRRKDALHKFSTGLVRRCGTIIVGDVSPQKLAKTRMAKSVNDAGWGLLKRMLSYKCDHAGIQFKVVGEAYTTRTCSSCGALSGPQGVNGLRIREWACVECGVTHDRDVNAARNILAAGHCRLTGEISCR